MTGSAFGEASGVFSGVVNACLKFQAERGSVSKKFISWASFQVMKLSAASSRESAGSQVSQSSNGSDYKS